MAPRNCDLTWVDASNGHIPTGAIQVIFYQYHHTNNGHLSLGAIRSFFNFSLYCCHHLQYVDKSLMFVFLKTNFILFQGGFNEENDPIYIGRAHHEDSYAVGKVVSLFLCLCHAA